MPLPRRHGLRTVTLSADGATARRQVTQVLEGRKTAMLRPLLSPHGCTPWLERPGESVLAVDHTGRSFAVLRVVSAGVTRLADVDQALCRAEDPDVDDVLLQQAAKRRAWLAARLRVEEETQVAWFRFRVVGREEEPHRPGGEPGTC